ncbi:hypothetical protein HK097_005997 [Rhizophlyctis rosea]|uniref:glucan 1,3-beta-glucosidase n=1 Tax=Rhizophlyctis rosea TaxID=64517 RepID=A0AAD5SEP2_9FUNG|nr:hypothetical protein HK097_005997 [Rhizophlyctis rosea]
MSTPTLNSPGAGGSPDSQRTVTGSYPPTTHKTVLPDWKPIKVEDALPPSERTFKPRRTRKARFLRICFGILVFLGLAALAAYFIWRHFDKKLKEPQSPSQPSEPAGWTGLDPAKVQPLDPNFRYRDLSVPFQYGVEPIRGVNVGGWLITEKFLNPSLYAKFADSRGEWPADEWHLSLAMGSKLSEEFDSHYSTYFVEDDFARIAQMGLNHVRIPFAHWVFPNTPVNGEPFYYGGSWKWLIQAVEWCRKYGLRVALDLHTAVGSQSGYDHTGRNGTIEFLNGTNGQSNADRTRQIAGQIATHFFGGNRTSPNGISYDHVTIFSTMNEPFVATINFDGLYNWYSDTYTTIRNQTSLATSTSPQIKATLANFTKYPTPTWPSVVINDGFSGEYLWFDLFPASRFNNLWMDFHKYISLNKGTDAQSKSDKFGTPCLKWRADFLGSRDRLGPAYMGEWSASWSATAESNFTKMTEGDKRDLAIWTQIQMDVAENSGIGWFFWNLKTEKSQYAHWDYYVGVNEGWIPRNFSAPKRFTCPPVGSSLAWCEGGACYDAEGNLRV